MSQPSASLSGHCRSSTVSGLEDPYPPSISPSLELLSHILLVGVALDDILQQFVHRVAVCTDSLLLKIQIRDQDAQHAYDIQTQHSQFGAVHAVAASGLIVEAVVFVVD